MRKEQLGQVDATMAHGRIFIACLARRQAMQAGRDDFGTGTWHFGFCSRGVHKSDFDTLRYIVPFRYLAVRYAARCCMYRMVENIILKGVRVYMYEMDQMWPELGFSSYDSGGRISGIVSLMDAWKDSMSPLPMFPKCEQAQVSMLQVGQGKIASADGSSSFPQKRLQVQRMTNRLLACPTYTLGEWRLRNFSLGRRLVLHHGACHQYNKLYVGRTGLCTCTCAPWCLSSFLTQSITQFSHHSLKRRYF